MTQQKYSLRTRFLILTAAVIGSWFLIFAAAHAEDRPSIEDINRAVNDQRGYNDPDATYSDGVYDCEDYAHDKIVALRAAGYIASEQPRMWRVIAGRGGPHAVVLLSGDRVMDNRFRGIANKQDLIDYHGYVFERPMMYVK